MALAYFEDALPGLFDSVPEWWQADNPTRELYRWLAALAASQDANAATAEYLYQELFLATADADGLLAEWAYAYGLRADLNSTLTVDQVRAYIQLWIAANGTKQSLLNLLTAIILLNPANQGGAVLTFDAGGAGLTFPSSGAGLTLYQYGTIPDQTVGFVFPANGAGLTFPGPGGLVFPGDGSGLVFPVGGAGLTFPSVGTLTFPNNAWVIIAETFNLYTFSVTVKSYLAFDRGAFKRAVERLRQAHTTWTYIESNS